MCQSVICYVEKRDRMRECRGEVRYDDSRGIRAAGNYNAE